LTRPTAGAWASAFPPKPTCSATPSWPPWRPGLAAAAERRLTSRGFRNVKVVVADGSVGYPGAAPYDAVLATAGAPQVPASLRTQLGDGARLVVPVGSAFHQDLVVIERRGGTFVESRGEGCVFVPLVGREGWPEAP
jgi:protein-L-isoaspartate(D-aspartate) O-methyltransferase